MNIIIKMHLTNVKIERSLPDANLHQLLSNRTGFPAPTCAANQKLPVRLLPLSLTEDMTDEKLKAEIERLKAERDQRLKALGDAREKLYEELKTEIEQNHCRKRCSVVNCKPFPNQV